MQEPNRTITCLYCGPIAPKGVPAGGGYVAANRKNIDELTAQGINVVELPYPDSKQSKFKKFTTLLSLPFKLIRYRRRDTVLHITLLYKTFIYFEAIIVTVAKCLGIKTVVDIRAGSFFIYFRSFSNLYRSVAKYVLKRADIITVEGSSYIDPIKAVAGDDKRIAYFPNVAICDDLAEINKPTDRYNLIYFGAINHNKGCDVVLQTIDLLDDRFRLYFAGTIYGSELRDAIETNPKSTYLGMLTPEKLRETLKDMHFFVFPSKHIGEGQSNSLIESMSMGVVPISSDQGFSAEVIGDCGAVLRRDTPAEKYAEAINRIVALGYDNASRKCRQHIIDCHNVTTEITKLINLYKSLLCH